MASIIPKSGSIFEDARILKRIFLFCKDRQEIASKYCILNKKIGSVLQSAPFKAEWIIKNSQNQLDLWLHTFLKKINLEEIHYQDWIANQMYRAPSSPLFIDNLVTKDDLVLSRLIHHYSSTAANSSTSRDRVKGLWVHLLLSRSLMALSLVLEDNLVFFQVLLSSPWLLKYCVYACVFTPTHEDSEKGLAVLKFILDNSKANSKSPSLAVLQEALALACRLDLAGHVEVLAPLCKQEKMACLWLEVACNKSSLPNTPQILSFLSSSLPASLRKFISQAKTLVVGKDGEEREPSSLKYLKFEQMILENSSKGYNESLRQLWCLLNEDCLLNGDFQGVLAFASFYSQDEHLILPLSQLGLAIQEAANNNNNVDAVAALEALLPLIDCVVPGKPFPTPTERLSTLFTEYCKTPKKQLFSQLIVSPVFSMQQLVRLKKAVLQHQLSVISYLYGALKKNDERYKIQSTDIWESIQAGNSELSALLQAWGGTPAWMEASDSNVSKKEKSITRESSAGGNSVTVSYAKEMSFTGSALDDGGDSDVDSQSGMFMAFDGEKSSFAATKRISRSYFDSTSIEKFSSDSLKSNRVNIFATDISGGGGGKGYASSSLLGARRINQQAKLLQESPVKKESDLPESQGGHSQPNSHLSGRGAGKRSSFIAPQSQQSNQIWDVYFKSDLKKLQKLLSETSLTNFDWMEVQDRKAKMKLGGDKIGSNKEDMGSLEDQAILQKYTQLY